MIKIASKYGLIIFTLILFALDFLVVSGNLKHLYVRYSKEELMMLLRISYFDVVEECLKENKAAIQV